VRAGLRVLLVVFAASGFAGLIYESIWTRYLGLFLGHAAYAQALVLAIFMGGMAIGAAIASRRSRRWARPLAAYAATEAAVGLLALVFHPLFQGVTGFAYDAVLPRLAGSAAAVVAVKWTLSAALILPQSVLLGLTFPLMTAGTLRIYPQQPGKGVALLYFTNSLGAAIGVLVSGFYLVPTAGLPGTLAVAGLLNLAIAAAVLLLFREGRAAPVPTSAPASRAHLFFLAVALITGASSFLYEVAWIRMLSLVLGTSTHSLELMLSAFILGLALGGLFIQRIIEGLKSPARALSILQVAMGALALVTLPLYAESFLAMRWLLERLPRSGQGYAVFQFASHAIALAIMLPATFCAGTTLPLITAQLLRKGGGEPSIGAVYAANTIGAITAVFFAVHVGLPFLGLKGLLVLGGAIDLALGVALAWSSRARVGLAAAGIAAVAAALVAVHLDPYQMASGVYRTGKILDPGQSVVLEHRDGKTATVSIVGHDDMTVLDIVTNGKVDAAVRVAPDRPPTPDEPMMVLLGAIPLSLAPRARSAACVGFGAGITTQALLLNPHLERVDTVEIEEGMVRAAARFLPRNRLAYSDPRSHIAIDDAKTFFSTSARKYDLIVSEPSNPWVSGVAGLFSTEFYGRVRRQLNAGGLLAQWIQLYELDLPQVISVLKALEANFADYAAYAATNGDLIIVARNGGEIGLPDPSVLRAPELARELARIGVRNLQDLELRRVGTRKSWEGLSRLFDVPANSDFAPVLDAGAARSLFLHKNAGQLLLFEKEPFPAVEMLSGSPPFVDTTATTPWPSFVGSRLGAEAMWLRDALLGRVDPDSRFVVSDDLHQQAGELSVWLRDCQTRPMPLRSLLRVAQSTVSQLTPFDLDAIWAEFHACEPRLSRTDRAWLSVLEALGRRDARVSASAARSLLADDAPRDPIARRFLLTAGMLGSIAQGDGPGARELWTRNRASIDARADLLLRMLVARTESPEPIAAQ
jgi:predicted membrane-bound spermidine synthase